MRSGIDYFPLDVYLDEKFELIEAEFGLTGFGVVVKLFQKIYGGQGYYTEWNEEVALLFSKKINEGGSVVSEIIAATIKRGIFDKTLYDKYRILTSVGIQKRYFEVVSRRKNVIVKSDYLLLNVNLLPKNVNISAENADILTENVDISKQSKVKESKVKESKVKGTPPTPSRAFNPISVLDSELCEGLSLKVKEKLKSWFMYKAEKRQSYKEQGFKAFMKKVFTALETNSEKEVCGVIDKSMENNWQGVFFENLPQSNQKAEVKYGTVV